jgi:hypothetical protein
MSYKSQLCPLSGTCETPLRLPIQGSWGSSPMDSLDMKFLRSWFVYDSEIQSGLAASATKRNRFLGLALLVGISASFWAGVGLMIARVWK